MTKTKEVPVCDECDEPMIFTFCIAYNEWACVPCGIAKPMFNGLEKRRIPSKVHDDLKEKYGDDLTILAFTRGGATCNICNKRQGNNCDTCQLPEKLVYWEQRGIP